MPASPSSNGQAVEQVTSTSVAKSALFKLPSELRTQIYEYALVQPDERGNPWTWVQGSIPEPALLLTCKLIPNEAILVFYKMNPICVSVIAFDTTNILQVWCKIRSLHVNHGRPISCHGTLDVRSPRRWPKLLEWFRAYHAMNAKGCVPATKGTFSRDFSPTEVHIIKSMFSIPRQTPWVEVDAILTGLGLALGALNRSWLAN